uniref:Putative lipocalin n=1 Tax=Ixodes ricinus TaxID=34613 RepID=A0A147BWZ4_IXORI
MFAALFLGIQLLGQSQADMILCEGDFPNATEVMSSLNRTYLLQSLQNISKLECAYQEYYYKKVSRDGLKHLRDAVYVYQEGSRRPQNNPLYIWEVVNYTIYLGSRSDFYKRHSELDILYSDSGSCMVIKNRDTKNFPKACNLWVTDDSFLSPPTQCVNGFRRHCGSNLTTYGIGDCVGRHDYKNFE